ncbi:MAG: homocysteine S-methyltransferase family protein [Candidatus Marinimicrobia bacterium]|nr:homocysteine S-methyltransferase family protein [Candidatus Neomarinimicrobiota bacterium]
MSAFKILDSAMGSELICRGIELPQHIWSAEANLTNPDLVLQIHKEYVTAGADYITANTFRTTPRAYRKLGVRGKETGGKNQEAEFLAKNSLNKAVEIAKEAAGDSAKVLGSIAPLEDCYSPDLFSGKDIAIKEFRQLGAWLSNAGVDILLLETMNSLAETEAGLLALQKFNFPVWVSFVLKDDEHLLSGELLLDALTLLQDYSVKMVLLNCNPLQRTENAMVCISENWTEKWGIYPNLGIGEPAPDGKISEYESMEKFTILMEKAIELGTSVVGGCCGSSPEHINELSKIKNKSNITSIPHPQSPIKSY